ncbi:hypothetical protein SLE2022_041360 [Rubroshorea leprosula]
MLYCRELASSTLIFFLISWGLRNKGPLYATIFNPLILIFVAIIASLFLDEKLHVGNMVGGILIIFGLYVVLWGKAKEMKWNTQSQLMPTTAFPDDGSVDIIIVEAPTNIDTTKKSTCKKERTI